jgi:hypothetical protein
VELSKVFGIQQARRASVGCFACICLLLLLALPGVARAAAPQIPATWVSDVTSTSAVLRAEIDPEGEATAYRFEYITAAGFQANLEAGHDGFLGAARMPGAKDAGAGAGTTPQPVFQNLVAPVNPLTPATSYRYRAVATNPGGVTVGATHTFTTEVASNVFALPDDRAWELVSPVDKGGGAIAAPGALFGGGSIQASAAGGALTYGSASSFGEAQGAPPGSQYVSRRGAAAWSTENISPPLPSAVYGDQPDGVPFRLFDGNLGSALLFGGYPCRGVAGCPSPAPPLDADAPGAYSTYYLREADGGYRSLLSAADFEYTAVDAEHFKATLSAATPDLLTAVLSTCAALTADAVEVVSGPGACSGGSQNLYRWNGEGLSLVNMLPAASTGTPGAQIAAPLGAVSTDGSRIYFTELEDGLLYLREFGSPTKWVGETLPSGAAFQTASADGSVAFVLAGGHLYRYLASTNTAADITPDGDVAGVLGASADAKRVYFQDSAGLELWDEGSTTLVAPGDDATLPSDRPPATATVRVSADGRYLAFLSKADLAGADTRDANTGAPDTELYLYDASAGSLTCASCNPTGERPRGSASIPGTAVNGSSVLYRPRALATDGQRLFFDSDDRLVHTDVNSGPDVYQWEAQGKGGCARSPGCVDLISSGRDVAGASFLDASADGGDVFFLTSESLVARDPGSIDVYDARVGGGLSEPLEPLACVGDACQALPSQPDDPTPGTLTPNPGNPPPRIVKEKRKRHHPKKHRKKRHHHKPKRQSRR